MGTSVKHGKPKKQKLEGKGGHGTGPGPGRPKSKNLQPKIQEYEFQDDPIDVPRIPKNDAPNRCVGVGWALGSSISFLAAPGTRVASSPREEVPQREWGRGVSSHGLPCSCPSRFIDPRRFWASVEPYCADLTNEEVRVLEELLKPPEDEAEHYKVKTADPTCCILSPSPTLSPRSLLALGHSVPSCASQ